MVVGINKPFKFPFLYNLVHNTIRTPVLERLISYVFDHVEDVGFEGVASVCDLGPTNQAAINGLRKNCPQGQYENVFMYKGRLITHVFDMAHVIKGFRNNFLTNDMVLPTGGVAKWDHLVEVYRKDRDLYRMLNKLTDSHMNPVEKQKMKVSMAMQVCIKKLRFKIDR